MELQGYLEETGMPLAELARRASINPRTIKNILERKADIRLSVALRLEDATKGQVKCRDLLSEEFLRDLHRKNLDSQTEAHNKNKEKKNYED